MIFSDQFGATNASDPPHSPSSSVRNQFGPPASERCAGGHQAARNPNSLRCTRVSTVGTAPVMDDGRVAMRHFSAVLAATTRRFSVPRLRVVTGTLRSASRNPVMSPAVCRGFPAGAGRAAAVDPAELDELIAAPHRELDWQQAIHVEKRDHRSVDVLGRVRFWAFPNDIFELGHGAHDHAVGAFPVAETPKRVARSSLRGCRGEEDCAVGLKISRHRWSSECRNELVAGWAASVAEVEISKERDLGHRLASSSMTWAVASGWVIIGQCPVSRVLNVQPGVLALMSAAAGVVERH